MYRIRPYLADIVVEPAKIMYHLPSYHETPSPSSSNLNGLTGNERDNSNSINGHGQQNNFSHHQADDKNKLGEEDPELVDRLEKMCSHLDTFIAKQMSQKEGKGKTSGTPKKPEPKKVMTKSTTGKDGGVMTSNLDKRTLNKSEPVDSQNINENLEKTTDQLQNEPKSSSNSPDVVHAGVQPNSHAVFPIHDYGDAVRKQFLGQHQQVEITVRCTDKPLITMLKAVGFRRNLFLLTDEDGVPLGQGATVVKVNFTADTLDSTSGAQEKSWKFLGSLVGLYSSDDPPVSALTDKWLSLVATTEIDELSRQLSSHLGAWDFLSSKHAICLADLVLRAQFFEDDKKLTPWNDVKATNNVQLWIKRIDEALSNL